MDFDFLDFLDLSDFFDFFPDFWDLDDSVDSSENVGAVFDVVTVDNGIVLDGTFGCNRGRFARTRLPGGVTDSETRGRVVIIADGCVETDGSSRGCQTCNHHLSWSLKFGIPVVAVLNECAEN